MGSLEDLFRDQIAARIRGRGYQWYAKILLTCLALATCIVLTWYFFPLLHLLACERSGQNELICVENELQQETVQRGMGPTFKTFTELYALDPSFSSICHYATHAIGQGAYQLYTNGEDIRPQSAFSYCGFGFYHGFLISLLAVTNDPRQAHDFCLAQARLSGASSSIQDTVMYSCMHGFGHGISEFDQVTDWSDPLAVVAPELAICKKIGTTQDEQGMCAGGVFNSLGEEFLLKNRDIPHYRGIIDPSHPFALCDAQSYEPFREACFRDFNSVIAELNKDDVAVAARYVAQISRKNDASLAMENLTDYIAKYVGNDDTAIQHAVAPCYLVRSDLVEPCIRGFVEGLLEFSTPGEEYVSAISMCNAQELQEKDRKDCFSTVVEASRRYPSSTFKTMCQAVPQNYRYLCEN